MLHVASCTLYVARCAWLVSVLLSTTTGTRPQPLHNSRQDCSARLKRVRALFCAQPGLHEQAFYRRLHQMADAASFTPLLALLLLLAGRHGDADAILTRFGYT